MPGFQYPIHLWALAGSILLLLLFFRAIVKKRKVAARLGDAVLVKHLTRHFSPRKYNIKFILMLLAFVFIAIAVANPRLPTGEQHITRSGIDLMIVLDVSNSMLATDLVPNRLERARHTLNRLLPHLGNNRVGLVIFAGKAYLQMPLTADHAAANLYFGTAKPSSVPTQGTAIGEALRIADLSFNPNDKKYKSVLLLSDGEDHDENAIDMAKGMASRGVMINVVGIGTPEGSTFNDLNSQSLKRDERGLPVISRLNEPSLRKIAAAGNGTYILYSSADEVVKTVMESVNSMEGRKIVDDSLLRYESLFQWFLLAALLLLMIETVMHERKKKRRVVNTKPAITLALVMVFFGNNAFAQSERELIKQGNKRYEKGEYQQAVEAYQSAALESEGYVPHLNLGNALYRTKEFDQAQKAYDNALSRTEDLKIRAEIFYNKGVVYQMNEQLPECIEAYKQALRINPRDEQARQNLQKALKQQNQQNQNQQQQKKQEQQQQQQQQSRISRRDAEDKLKALQQQERKLHDKLKKGDPQMDVRPQKDW